jgi:hypothetical protein
MRKLFLISVFVLASAAAQAGQSRGLVLAANDEQIQSVQQSEQPKADPQPQAATPATDAAKPAAEVSRPTKEDAKPVRKASRPVHRSRERGYASEEAEARSIAARYGVSW